MLVEAAQAASAFPGLQLLAVTVLTSLSDGELDELGFDHSTFGQVALLSRLARDSGIRGLVCSPLEVAIIRREIPDAILVTPGVRPAGSPSDDQTRIATPQEALASGSSHVVIGRPILKAPDPEALVASLLAS
jgi:orotidine-5'-phosphate decarboxylase